MKKSIEFSVKPDWDEVEKIRNESADFLQSHELSDDIIRKHHLDPGILKFELTEIISLDIRHEVS